MKWHELALPPINLYNAPVVIDKGIEMENEDKHKAFHILCEQRGYDAELHENGEYRYMSTQEKFIVFCAGWAASEEENT